MLEPGRLAKLDDSFTRRQGLVRVADQGWLLSGEPPSEDAVLQTSAG